NLVFPDANLGKLDVYVYDVDFPAVERVSVNSAGTQAAIFDSQLPSISQDGRYVAFESAATNLVEGDTNNVKDVFIRDRVAGLTFRVSVNTSGNQSAAGQTSSFP